MSAIPSSTTRKERNSVPELIAKSALAGQAPLALAGTTLAEAAADTLISIAPFPGKMAAVNAALAPLGLTFPAPNQQSTNGTTRLIWAGRDLAFLIGVPAPAGLQSHAALTDQTDGWASLTLTGPHATDALARLVPLDLRPAAFPVGQTMRSALNHMQMMSQLYHSMLYRDHPPTFHLLNQMILKLLLMMLLLLTTPRRLMRMTMRNLPPNYI